jgi:cell division initiation protein
MKITSKDILQKTFEKNFRGYDKDEVTAYLGLVADAWDRLEDEKTALERDLEISRREAKKLKDVEESLFRTLKTAEDTGVSIIEEANQAANDILADAKNNAEAMLADARKRSNQLLELSEAKAKTVLADLKADVQKLVKDYEALLKERDQVLKNLKKISEDIQHSVEVSQESFKKINAQTHANLVAELEKSKAFTLANLPEPEVSTPTPSVVNETPIAKELAETAQVQRDEPVAESNVTAEEVAESQVEMMAEAESGESRIEEETPRAEETKSKPDKGSSFFDQFD